MTTFTPSFALDTDTQNLVDWCEVQSVSVYGGRYDTMTQPTPRVLTAQLTNWGTGGSFVPPNIGDNIKFAETNLNVTLFYGFITDITFSYRNYGNGNGIPTYTVTATSHIASLDWNHCTNGVSYSLDYAGAQILAMMSDWGLSNRGTVTYSSTTMPQTGGATLDAVSPADTDNLGDVIRYTAQSAGGVFYERSNGNVYYDRRVDRQNRTAIVLTNDDIISDISFTKSITAIANDATVVRTGTDATASDSTSIGKFGKRSGSRDTRLHLLTDAQTIADSLIAAFKSPVWRPDTVTVSLQNPAMTDSVRSAIATVFCGSKITIPIPSDIGSGTATYYVENFTLQAGRGTLDVSLGLAPVADSV
jgi:hypothetical protein